MAALHTVFAEDSHCSRPGLINNAVPETTAVMVTPVHILKREKQVPVFTSKYLVRNIPPI